MTLSTNRCRSSIPLCVFTCLVLYSQPMLADSQKLGEQFENCVATQIANERAAKKPNAARVLAACEPEFAEFLRSLPPGPTDELRRDAEHYIEEQLKT